MVSRRTIAAFMGAAGRWTAIWRESLLMMLWTAPPPARECHECVGC